MLKSCPTRAAFLFYYHFETQFHRQNIAYFFSSYYFKTLHLYSINGFVFLYWLILIFCKSFFSSL